MSDRGRDPPMSRRRNKREKEKKIYYSRPGVFFKRVFQLMVNARETSFFFKEASRKNTHTHTHTDIHRQIPLISSCSFPVLIFKARGKVGQL